MPVEERQEEIMLVWLGISPSCVKQNTSTWVYFSQQRSACDFVCRKSFWTKCDMFLPSVKGHKFMNTRLDILDQRFSTLMWLQIAWDLMH